MRLKDFWQKQHKAEVLKKSQLSTSPLDKTDGRAQRSGKILALYMLQDGTDQSSTPTPTAHYQTRWNINTSSLVGISWKTEAWLQFSLSSSKALIVLMGFSCPEDSSHMSKETVSARISHMENYVDYTSGEFGSMTTVFAGLGCF